MNFHALPGPHAAALIAFEPNPIAANATVNLPKEFSYVPSDV